MASEPNEATMAELTALVKDCNHPLRRTMLNYCVKKGFQRCDAEILVHEAVFRVWEKLDAGKEIDHWHAYLWKVLRRRIDDDFRYRAVRRNSASLADLRVIEDQVAGLGTSATAPECDPASCVEFAEMVDAVRKAIAQLEEHHRTVVELAVYENLNGVQIARRLGCDPTTARDRLLKAIQKLGRLLHDWQ